MPIESTAAFVDLLRSIPLLPAARCEEVAGLQARYPDPRGLARELVQRDWLTAFQANRLFAGRGSDLVLGSYVLLERRAEGGLGEVFKARHVCLARLAAVKRPRPDQMTEDSLARCRREARALALLNHPNVVTLYDAGESEGRPFLAMEYVEGPTLAALLKKGGRPPVSLACAYVRQAALALAHLHERGVIHRDVSPNNLVLAEKEGLVKLVGLGLCRLDRSPDNGEADSSLTLPGQIMGTPGYMAPEQIEDCHAADGRADLYALGCTLYELLAGQPPFAGPFPAVLAGHLNQPPPPLQGFCPDLPPGVAAVVERLLAKRPRERYGGAAEVAAALEPFCGPVAARTALPEALLERYQVLERLAETNMSQVFKVRDLRLGRVVVLKVLHDTLLADPKARARFQREALAAALLKHPNVVQVYDAGEADGRPFLLLEYVEGRSLNKLIKEAGALPAGRACEFIRQAALALEHLHERGVIHRDVSPANLIATAGETAIKLIDLGLVRLERPPEGVPPEEPRTVTTQVMGTPDFMAPEQANDPWKAGRAADIYGLGCTLYFLLSGRLPFPGGTVAEKLYRHQEEQPEALLTGVPGGLAAVVGKMTAKRPDQRYQSAAEVARDLDAFASQQVPTFGTRPIPTAPPAALAEPASAVMAQPPEAASVISARTACGPAKPLSAPRTQSRMPPMPPLPPLARRAATSGPPFPAPSRGRRIALGVKNLLRRAARLGRLFRSDAGRDLVDCTVFAPPEVPPGGTVLVQVFAHLPEAAAAARELAREFDASAERRAFKSLPAEVARGATLTFHLAVTGVAVEDGVQSLLWRGRTESVSFAVTVPGDRPPGTAVGTVTVSLDGIPLGHIKFKLTVGFPVRGDVPQAVPLGEAVHRYRKAFISYASKDRGEVLKRVQMLRSLRIGFFQDVLDLEPGDRWEQQLYRHIDDSDLFLLFWSSAARESPWVLEEVRYALKRKRGDDAAPPSILPVILEGPPPPAPPAELAHLQFADYLFYFMNPAPP
jgi:serine/threonine protein kinase